MVLLVQKYMVLSMMYINVKLLYDSNLNLNIAKMVLFMMYINVKLLYDSNLKGLNIA